jgi:hypothetical protein
MVAAMRTYGSPVNLLMAVRPLWVWEAALLVATTANLLPESVIRDYRRQVQKVDPVRRHLAPDSPRGRGDENTDGDYDDLAQGAAKSFRLVLVEGSVCREVCWDGVWLPADWFKHEVAWQLFSQLVRRRAWRVIPR